MDKHLIYPVCFDIIQNITDIRNNRDSINLTGRLITVRQHHTINPKTAVLVFLQPFKRFRRNGLRGNNQKSAALPQTISKFSNPGLQKYPSKIHKQNINQRKQEQNDSGEIIACLGDNQIKKQESNQIQVVPQYRKKFFPVTAPEDSLIAAVKKYDQKMDKREYNKNIPV